MATAASITTVQKAYIAYYGRPADPVGLDYWATALDNARGNMSSLINAFGTSTEATALYAGQSTAQMVNNLYLMMFNRETDVAGLTYYVNRINTGASTLATVMLDVLNGASGTDATSIANKLAAASAFTTATDTTAEIIAYSGNTAATTARAWLATFDATTTATPDPTAVLSGLVTANQTFVLTAGATSVDEGGSATFSLATTNVSNGATIAYTLSGVSAADVTGGSLTGTATVSNNKATITVGLVADNLTEGAETLKVALDNGKASATTIVNDTSLTPTYTLTADQTSVNEGGSATFTLQSSLATDTSTVSYAISGTGITAADVTGGLTGTATLVAGKATITVAAIADAATEGAETMTVTAASKTATTTINDTSITPVMAADKVAGTIVNGQGTAIMTPTDITAFRSNDLTDANVASTGTVTVDMASAVGGQLVALTNGNTMFVANAGVRQGSFQYSDSDIAGLKGTVNVTLNSAPVVTSAATLAVTEDIAATGTVTATDADSDTLTYTFGTASKGTITATGGAFTYTPTANANGTDTFKVTVSDGYSTTTQDIAVTIAAVDDPPAVVSPAPAATAAKAGASAVTVDLSTYATDVDTAVSGLTFTADAKTALGGVVTVSGNTATINYSATSGAAATGADTFKFNVTDGTTTVSGTTVNVTVTNTAPVATDFALAAKTGVTQTIDLTGKVSDADSNTLTPVVTVGSVSAGGSAEVISGKIVYTSTVGYVGTETVKYTVTDGYGGTSNTGTITFTVASNTGGTSGDDLLYGSTAAENIDGLAGNDTINGGGGLDTITGGDGNDTITFSDGAYMIQGGNGLDTLVLGATAVGSIYDFSATSTVSAAVTGATLTTTNQLADVNSVNSLGKNVVLLGFENIDASKATAIIFEDAAGTTSIITGTGADTLYLNNATGTASISTNDGADTITIGGTGTYVIDAGAGNDTITGGTGNDSIGGGAGDDTFTMGNNLTSADTLDGGAGTDVMTVTTNTVDSAFTKITTLENVTITGAVALTLGSIAQAAGITTATFGTAGSTESITVGVDFTNALTVVANDPTVADVLDASAYSGVLTLQTADTAGLSDVGTFTGGTGTGDTITYSLASGSVTQVASSTITAFENIGVTGSTTNSLTVTLDELNVAGSATLTIDASSLTTGVLTVDASAETNGLVVVKGGGGADTITGSASTFGGDKLTGGAGNDTFTMGNNLTSVDTIDGGSGTDTISVTTATTDTEFTAVTNVENVTVTGAGIALTLGSIAQAAGVTTATFGTAGTAESITVGVDFTNALTVVSNDPTVADVLNAAAYSGVLTLTTANAAGLSDVGTFTGGTGTGDTILYDITSASITDVASSTVTAFENIGITGSTTNSLTLVLDNANVAASSTLSIDASSLTTGILTVDASAEADGYVIVKGGGGADTITGSASSLSDNLSGGAGNDTFTMGNNLTSTDTIDGGSGTDTISVTTATIDTAFTKVTNVENVTVTGAGIALTLGSIAQAAGVTTATFGTAGTAESITVGVDFTNALTIVANDPTVADVVDASAYSGVLTVQTAQTTGLSDAGTFTGGTGTGDTIAYDLATAAGTVTQVASATITGFENMTITGANSVTSDLTITLDNANVAASATLTIDASSMTTGVLTVTATAESDGYVVVKGGAAADTVTISASSLGDNLTLNGGADIINVTTTANLTSIDTIAGGSGNDILNFSEAAGNAIVDSMFTNITSVENVVLTTDTTGQSVTLGTAAVAAGVNVVSAAAVVTETKSVTIDLSGMVGSAGVSIVGGSGSDIILGGTGNDTIDGGALSGSNSTVANDVIAGGAGADTITSGGAGCITTIRVNLNADVAAGTTLANADQITGFITTLQFYDVSGATLMSTGGTILALTNAAVTDSVGGDAATENDTVAKDDLGSTTATRFISGTAASMANLGSLANQTGLVFQVTTDIVTGTTGVTANSLLNQAGVDEAVAYITANIGTATVANTNVLFAVNDGANSAIFQYQEGTLDQGIQSSELTLVGVFVGVTTFNAGDLV